MSQPHLFWLLLEVSGVLTAIWLRSARREAPIDNIVKICSQGSSYRQQTPSQMLSASSRDYGPSLPARTLFKRAQPNLPRANDLHLRRRNVDRWRNR